jgi:hypothetical protein
MVPISDHPLYKKHDIDSAMNSFWLFYKQRFIPLFLISLAMSLITQYGSSLINTKELQDFVANNTSDPFAVLEKVKSLIVPILILATVSLFFSTIMHYYILMKPLGGTTNIFTAIFESLKYFVPYLIVVIILAFFGSIAILAGLVVFIVGVIFSIIYVMMISLFILPVMMSEGNNIGNTIMRTARLSHRNFWSNIGWTAVFLILFIVIAMVFSAIVMLPFTGSILKTVINPGEVKPILDLATNPIYIFLTAAVNAIILPFFPIFGFLLYFNGRAGEEPVIPPSYGDKDYKVKVEDLYAKPLDRTNEG